MNFISDCDDTYVSSLSCRVNRLQIILRIVKRLNELNRLVSDIEVTIRKSKREKGDRQLISGKGSVPDNIVSNCLRKSFDLRSSFLSCTMDTDEDEVICKYIIQSKRSFYRLSSHEDRPFPDISEGGRRRCFRRSLSSAMRTLRRQSSLALKGGDLNKDDKAMLTEIWKCKDGSHNKT